MAITRYEPFREFALLQDRMNRLFGDTYLREDEATRGAWVPPVDIFEDEGTLVLRAEVPDVPKDQIRITVENNVLTLQGERPFPTDTTEGKFLRMERSYGPFSRSFTLPNTVDGTHVKAQCKDGVLTVQLPYREEAKPRTIDIEVVH